MKRFEFYVKGEKAQSVKAFVFKGEYTLLRQHICKVPGHDRDGESVTYWFNHIRKTRKWTCTRVVCHPGKAAHEISALRIGHFEVKTTGKKTKLSSLLLKQAI